MNKLVERITTAALGAGFALGMFYLMPSKESDATQIVESKPEIPVRQVNSYINAAPPSVVSANGFVVAAEKSLDCVVHIKTVSEQQVVTRYNDPFYEFFFGPGYQKGSRKVGGSGSGVIFSPEGYIMTNNHVIKGATEIQVVLNDHRTFEATVVGADPSTDLALLKIEGGDLDFIELGNSDNVKVGQSVLAVGNPFNLTSTVTAGIVSAKGRNLDILQGAYKIESFIQTDAAVNPGNSGGALVDTEGKLIGINTAIASQTGSYVGYAFAVPVNLVKKVMKDLKEHGEVKRGRLGIAIREVDGQFAEEKGLDVTEGVYIANIVEGSGAEKAGMEIGDVIVKIEDNSITKFPELQEQLGRFSPGDHVNVTVMRDSNPVRLNVQLTDVHNRTTSYVAEEESEPLFMGAKLEAVNDDLKKKLNLKYGVQIKELQRGRLAGMGLSEGFIITEINNQPIKKPEDVENILNGKKDAVLLEGVYPSGAKEYKALRLD